MSTGTTPKLDKSHGFMKFIITNQIDRDNYEKEQNELQKRRCEERNQAKLSPKSSKAKRKDRALYTPPHLRGTDSSVPRTKSCSQQDQLTTDSLECGKQEGMETK